MSRNTVKENAGEMVDQLPEGATWDDLMQQIYVRQAVEAGLEDCRRGRMIEVGELRKRFGLGG
ncbi:MAG: hypothetical protein QNK37_19475 [Acidobacteriota bacterium]|nr:hypothetical protein [Acidobacteriota bacterium]